MNMQKCLQQNRNGLARSKASLKIMNSVYWSLGQYLCLCMLKIKKWLQFKHRYSISNMGLIGYNKRFFNLSSGAPGSKYDASFLHHTGLFKQALNAQGLPAKTVDLRDEYGKILLFTIGDSAFPRFSWLLKYFNCNTNDERERYYSIKVINARVVTENCYGILKSCWRILYKKVELKIFNLKYIIIAWVMLDNFCIAKNTPCNPRWRLKVEELELNNTVIKRRAQTKKNQTRMLKKLQTGYGRKLNSSVWILLFLNYKLCTTGFL